MQLISQTAVEGRPGPNFPEAYPRIEGLSFNDPRAFMHGQPFDTFAKMRKAAPVAWHPEPGDFPGFWAVTRHADVMRVNGDPATFSSQRGGILMDTPKVGTGHVLLGRASFDTMINMDAPQHLQLRREHMPFFTPAYLNQLKVKVQTEVTRLIDNMAPKGDCDLVEEFSSRLPLFTLCEILGVPEPDRGKFLHWMHYLELAQNMANDQATLTPSIELMQFVADFNSNVEEMFAYGQHMMHKRRQDPQADLMTAIARAQVDGEMLSDEYLDGSWLLIVFAGNDTTRNTLSGAMKLLTEFPDQKAKLAAQPELLGNAADEFIRMVSPVIYMRRTALQDAMIADQQVAEGEKVIMYYGAANRDPAVFENPDTLDVARANANKHIAFGYGPHVCLGKRVAQIQLEEAYRQLLGRLPDIKWNGAIDIAPNNFVHAIRSLGVSFTAKG
ncbi:MAG: cytochrome P450 [Hyphomonadaceae bacterium]